MCSVPGLPMPGSEVSVLMTRVDLRASCGLVELWVNIDDGRKDMYQKMREDIQIPERRFHRSEGKPGDLCLDYISDTWHRARIVSIQNENYNIFLIDQGQSHITSWKDLAWGACYSFLLPAEIELCILANVLTLDDNCPRSVKMFLESLSGKTFNGLVKHVLELERIILLDIPNVSKEMCDCGLAKEIPFDEFKCLVPKCLNLSKGKDSEAYSITQEKTVNVTCQFENNDQYFYPELLTNTFETVKVTEVTNPQNMFCKLLIFSKAVKILSEQIHQYYEKTSDLGEAQPKTCGDPCAAKALNGRWHRSLLKQNLTSNGAVEVLHIDEGHTELVPVGDIKPLHGKFLRMPVVTYPCCLNGVKDKGWTTEQTDYLKSLLLNQTVMARFDRHNISQDIYDVTLYANNAACINKGFMEKTGLLSPCRTEQDSNIQNEVTSSLFLHSHGYEQCMDVQSKPSINGGLQDETFPSTKNQAINGRTYDVPTNGTDDIHVKDGSEPPDTPVQNNGHLSTAEMSNACNDHEFTAGTEVGENVSCIESLKLPVLDQQLSNGLKHASVPNEDCLIQEYMNASVVLNTTEQVVHSSNGVCTTDELKMSSQSISYVSAPENTHEKTLGEGGKPTLDVMLDEEQAVSAETLRVGHSNSEVTQCSDQACPEGYVKTYMYKRPNISLKKTEELYASCIVGPDYFWCQYANTAELDEVTRLAQEAGQTQQDILFPSTLEPGSPCLAIFSNDNQWYRAQVIDRLDSVFHVVFIDYGNESDVDIKNVRPLPQGLLDKAPQAFLCSLNGFDESRGSWDDEVYDDFYNLLFNKPLTLTVFNMRDHLEIAVPQCSVEIECEGVIVNAAMQKYWKAVAKEQVLIQSPKTDALTQDCQTESNVRNLSVSTENMNTSLYKEPQMSKNIKEEVYASCIAEPTFFWCQYANTEELNKVSKLAQEAGRTQLDMMFTKTLGPGNPCLALFSVDNQWYRAQVINRLDNAFHVVFIDYGNESDVDIKNVRPLPQCLLDMPPQAFLCSLNGFDESRGSWDDDVYDDFFNLLVNKPLTLTVHNMEAFSEIGVLRYSVGIDCEGVVVNTAMQKYWKPVAKECVSTESSKTETLAKDCQMQSYITHLNVSKENMNNSLYKEPKMSKNRKEEVYASCIVGPSFFWCQYANTEELNRVSRLAQEAGKRQLDMMFSKTLGPGSPCLALFSSDNQWYRAQVIERINNAFRVVFIDYGNESDVDIKNVRPLPRNLLDLPPQASLCSLNGFDESRGSWDDEVYDDFYNLLVDKPLTLTVFNMKGHSEIAAPQYTVQIEYKDNVTCEWLVVNRLMEKHWKGMDTDHALAESV